MVRFDSINIMNLSFGLCYNQAQKYTYHIDLC